MTSKNNFMLRAIELSINSANGIGGPFGCVIVKDDKITNFKYKCEACIFCQASVSLLSRKAKNKTVEKIDSQKSANNSSILKVSRQMDITIEFSVFFYIC